MSALHSSSDTLPNPLDLDDAVAALRRGHVVGVPTETWYGLAADARSDEAVGRVLALKGRDTPSPVLVPDVAALSELVSELPLAVTRFCQRVWPGPVTVILEHARSELPAGVRQGSTIAVRQDGHPVLRELLARFAGPVTGTSANRTGESPFQRGQDVEKCFSGDRDAGFAGYVGGQPTEGGRSSTIVALPTEAGTCRILRPGPVGEAELAAIWEACR